MARSCILQCRDANRGMPSTYMKNSPANRVYRMSGCCWMDSCTEISRKVYGLSKCWQRRSKSQELDGAYCCLLPCWRKEDLFTLGEQVYNFEDMDDRFYLSGGSVQEFTCATLEDIQTSISKACSQVADASYLFSLVDRSGVVELRHTFVQDVHVAIHYLSAEYWQQVVDSEYVIMYLSRDMRSEDLLLLYHWAWSVGYNSPAGFAFEICLHRLAVNNNLSLHMSEYDTSAIRTPRQELHFGKARFKMKKGIALCSDKTTGSGSTHFDEELEQWRDDDHSSYWYPTCDNFPNIDSIVKLQTSDADKKSCVAFLQITIAGKHDMDSEQLEKMNEIFKAGGREAPIFIALCPSLESCKQLRLNPTPGVLAARKVCQVFVGCYDEAPLRQYNVPFKEYAALMRRYQSFRPRKRGRKYMY